ncbi:type IV pilus assembly protein PilW [Pseudomonas graminis]|uniref:PilW family protein n=1 Tax=Pseudomonas graminis TaxID=158627 RepID=UPI001061DB5F|nr:PilW family protein [Pseudomonas graminis]TDV51187.1 type IV pilus assembly protein PilW [Pseudomonas graminis]
MNGEVLPYRQIGVSLIELMVAMVIGLFLILGVTQIFISNQRTYLFQQAQMGNQENGRFTLAILSQELLKAGYRSSLGAVIPADNSLSGCSFPMGASVVALSESSLCVQYQATSKLDVSCQGAALAMGDQDNITTPYSAKSVPTTVRPKIVEKIAFDSANKAITCTSGATTQQLVSGVQDLRFEYGSDPSDPKAVSKFSTTAPTGTIAAVRYSALMQSPGTSTIRDSTTAISSALTDWNGRYGTSYNDTKGIYQIVQGTIMVRNQMP